MSRPPRHPFTLIEVLVSTILGVFLIGSLLQLTFFSKQKEKISSQIGSRAIAWLEVKDKLEETLSLAEPLSAQVNAEGSGLYFTFENGIDVDPHFCGRCRARLWEEESVLFLTLFGREKERTCVLWRGDAPITFALWDGKKKESTQFARIDRRVQAVIINFGAEELICPLHRAPILEVL